MRVQSLSQEDPWSRKWQPTPVSWLGKCHGQKSLEGYSPGGCKKSDMTEPGESQRQRSLVGCHLWGHTESSTTEATQQQQQQQTIVFSAMSLLKGRLLSIFYYSFALNIKQFFLTSFQFFPRSAVGQKGMDIFMILNTSHIQNHKKNTISLW